MTTVTKSWQICCQFLVPNFSQTQKPSKNLFFFVSEWQKKDQSLNVLKDNLDYFKKRTLTIVCSVIFAKIWNKREHFSLFSITLVQLKLFCWVQKASAWYFFSTKLLPMRAASENTWTWCHSRELFDLKNKPKNCSNPVQAHLSTGQEWYKKANKKV